MKFLNYIFLVAVNGCSHRQVLIPRYCGMAHVGVENYIYDRSDKSIRHDF